MASLLRAQLLVITALCCLAPTAFAAGPEGMENPKNATVTPTPNPSYTPTRTPTSTATPTPTYTPIFTSTPTPTPTKPCQNNVVTIQTSWTQNSVLRSTTGNFQGQHSDIEGAALICGALNITSNYGLAQRPVLVNQVGVQAGDINIQASTTVHEGQVKYARTCRGSNAPLCRPLCPTCTTIQGGVSTVGGEATQDAALVNSNCTAAASAFPAAISCLDGIQTTFMRHSTTPTNANYNKTRILNINTTALDTTYGVPSNGSISAIRNAIFNTAMPRLITNWNIPAGVDVAIRRYGNTYLWHRNPTSTMVYRPLSTEINGTNDEFTIKQDPANNLIIVLHGGSPGPAYIAPTTTTAVASANKLALTNVGFWRYWGSPVVFERYVDLGFILAVPYHTWIELNGVRIDGTLVAPRAKITGRDGQINGVVIAGEIRAPHSGVLDPTTGVYTNIQFNTYTVEPNSCLPTIATMCQ